MNNHLTLALVCATLSLAACGDLTDDDQNTNTEARPGGSLDFGAERDDSGASCVTYFDCAGDCETESCSERCFDALSGQAQRQLNDLYSCAERNECPDGQCVRARCSSELEACIGEPVSEPEPATSGRCPDFFECAGDCASDACYERCFDSLQPREQQELVALIECNSEHGCDDSSCLERNCGRELNACAN